MTIDHIIARELTGLRAVSLPFVGTLYAHRVPVHRVAGLEGKSAVLRLLPPAIEVSLDDGFYDDRSIIVLLQCYFPNLDEEGATLLYNRWVAGASDMASDTLVVEGVCRISTIDFSLSIDPSTTALLHPGYTFSLADLAPSVPLGVARPVVSRPVSGAAGRVRVWPALVGLGVAVGYIVYVLWSKGA